MISKMVEINYLNCTRWLSIFFRPKVAVRAVKRDLTSDIYIDDLLIKQYDEKNDVNIDAYSILLDSDDVLESRLHLPRMDQANITEAVNLYLTVNSPFPPEDTDFGWIVESLKSNDSTLLVAIASKNKVSEYFKRTKEHIGRADLEVWYAGRSGKPVRFTGYGGEARSRLYRKYRLIGWNLCFLMAATVLAIAATPTAQLRLRAIDAYHQYEALVDSTKIQVQKKSQLIQLAETSKDINNILSNRIDVQKLLVFMTANFPDDTHVLNLDVSGLSVKVVGVTSNSNNLIKLLGDKNEINSLRMPVPVTRQPGSSQEGFTLEFNAGSELSMLNSNPASQLENKQTP